MKNSEKNIVYINELKELDEEIELAEEINKRFTIKPFNIEKMKKERQKVAEEFNKKFMATDYTK